MTGDSPHAEPEGLGLGPPVVPAEHAPPLPGVELGRPVQQCSPVQHSTPQYLQGKSLSTRQSLMHSALLSMLLTSLWLKPSNRPPTTLYTANPKFRTGCIVSYPPLEGPAPLCVAQTVKLALPHPTQANLDKAEIKERSGCNR